MTYEMLASDITKLRRCLQELLRQTEADSCLICDQAGHVLAEENVAKQADPLIVSALGAGVFAATRELARMLGEDEFSSVLHQGLQRSILISAANEEALVVVLFSGEERTGLVKLYTPASAARVRGIFDEVTARGAGAVESKDRNFIIKDKASFTPDAR